MLNSVLLWRWETQLDESHAKTGTNTNMPKPNQDAHYAQVDPGQTQSRSVCTHTQKDETDACLDPVPILGGDDHISSTSTAVSEPDQIAITRHARQKNCGSQEMYWFSRRLLFIHSSGETQAFLTDGLVWQEFAKRGESSAFIFLSV